jgi:IS5 family transposase
VFGDAGYQGVEKRDETQGFEVEWHVAMRPGKRRAHDKTKPLGRLQDELARIKGQFGHVKVRYRGLMKNTQQLHTLFALSNLWMMRHRLQS